MSLWDRISNKLGAANESLSTASKQWRDESLSARDESLSAREDTLYQRERRVKRREQIAKARLKEVRELEARQSRRKWLYVLSALAGAVPAFILGIASGSPLGKPLENTAAHASTSQVPHSVREPKPDPKPAKVSTGRIKYSDPYTALDEGKYGRGRDINVGYYCLDVEATGDATFEECIGAVALALSQQN